MKDLDFKTIFNEVVPEVKDELLNHYHRSLWVDTDALRAREGVRQMLSSFCLKACIARYDGSIEVDSDPKLFTEKAVLMLKQRGILQEPVTFRKNWFRVRLPNCAYRISKGVGRLKLRRESNVYYREVVFPYSLQDFVDFLCRFDEAAPALEDLIDPLMAEMQEVLLQEKKREMAEKLKRTMVDSLIRQFLEPLNLQVNYELTKEDGVHLSIRQTKETTLDLSLDKIAEVLSDTEGLLQSMEVVNPAKESEKRKLLKVRLGDILTAENEKRESSNTV